MRAVIFFYLPREVLMDYYDSSIDVHWSGMTRSVKRGIIYYSLTVWRPGQFNYVIRIERISDFRVLMCIFNEDGRVCWADDFPFAGDSSSLRVTLRGSFMSFLKKLDGSKKLKSAMETNVDESISKKHPALYEYLTATQFEDGSERVTATLSISVADDGWKFCLRDRENSRCLWVTSMSFMEAFKTLDKALQSEDAGWVRDRFSGANKSPSKNGKKS